MQQGMLFHTLYAAQPGVYCAQWSCTLHGNLQASAFKRVWQRVMDRHPVLRTAFRWELRDEPFQVVYRHAELPWRQYDWRGASAAEQEQQLEVFLREDRAQGFDLSKAPLMRLTLVRLAEDACQFICSLHHLLLDGWSLHLILQEVFRVYDACCAGQEPHLAVSRPYSDYIAWLQRQDLSRAEQFWRQMLRGFTMPTVLQVGQARGSSSDKDAGYDEQQMRLSASVTAALRAMAQQHHLSLNTLVQGAWAILLSRYSGQEDVVFGAAVSGRPTDLAGIESMIGLFINTLPVRVRVVPEESLLPWLQEIQTQQVEARQYEYSPLVQVQGWSDVPPGLPLFESILVFENYPTRTAMQEWSRSLEIRRRRFVSSTNYPLTIIPMPGPTLALQIGYQCHRFDAATITRMLGHLRVLLEGMATHPTQRLLDLQILTAAERHQLLITWNDTSVAYPQDAYIHQLFEAQVARTPDAMAVVFEEQTLTYRELNVQANKLAHHLQVLGVGPEVRVGIYIERSCEMVVGLLGILKAGGAYVPLDPTYPKARLAFMLLDAQVPVLLTQHRLVTSLPPHVVHLVCLDTDWERITQQRQDNPVSGVTPENLAYVMYTSGSTGHPKGVMIPHRALSNHMHWMQATFPLTETDRVLQKTSISFDASVWELFAPLLAGARLIIARPGGHRDSAYLVGLIAEHQITALKLVPSLFQVLIDEEAFDACQSLQHVFSGGEVLSPALQEQFFSRLDASLHNLYGPTEATIDVTFFKCERGSNGNIVPVGRPIANTQIYLLDARLKPVPIGIPGELYVGGDSLTRGYLNRPELTAQYFIDNPFSEEPGARLYKTGDLARYLPDGNIEFLGRLDYQIKIRGHRIELGEIESTLVQHPSIRQAVVQNRKDAPGGRYLVAYIVPNQNHAPTRQALQVFLQTKLPEYMIPSAFVMLHTLPLTTNGKVDRQALPEPEWERLRLDKSCVVPRTPLEELLVTLWEHVLEIDTIGIHDNFFALGGHSLLAMQMVSRLRRRLEIDVSIRALFEAPTIASLASHIEAVRRSAQSVPAHPIRPVSRTKTTPLAMSQEHFWELDRLLPGAPFSNMPYAVRLIGDVDAAILERSFSEIIKRHEILRTTFTIADGRPAQVIAPAIELSLTVTDLQALPRADREAEAERLIRHAMLFPFDLTQGPLMHVELLRIDKREYVLLLIMHHIISDGWSMGVLTRELSTLYMAFSCGKPSLLPGLTLQYADFSHWQHSWLHSEARDSQLAYWKQQLNGPLPALEIPTDRPRTGELNLHTERQAFQLPQSLLTDVKSFSQQEGTTLFMTLASALNMLLYSYTRQPDIRIGTLVANRQQPGTEGLIGLFVNLVVLRTNLGGNATLRETWKQIRTTTLDAFAHQELPFEYLVRTLERENGLDRLSLFQVMFGLQTDRQRHLQLPDIKVEELRTYPFAASTCEIAIAARESHYGLELLCSYKPTLFNAATINHLLEHFQSVLECLISHPEKRLHSLNL